MADYRNIAVAALAVTLIFLFPCLAGSSGQVAWSRASLDVNGCTNTIQMGLLSTWSYSSCTKGVATIMHYDSNTCSNTFGNACDRCNSAGKGVLSFTVFALLSILPLMGMVVQNKVQGERAWSKMLVAGLAGFLCFCYFICWTVWLGGCQAPFKKKLQDLDNSYKVAPGAGWALAFLSFLFTFACAVIELKFSGNEPNFDGAYESQGDAESDM